jgi:carbamoyl-phosphate synthase large subunit
MAKLRVAVVGVGNMGRNHARNYSEMKGVELVGVSDINAKAGREAAKAFKTKFYKDYKKLIDKEHPDAVSIAVPTTLHKRIALDFIKRKISVLIEKPLAPTPSDCKEIIHAAKAKGVVLGVGHIERFNPAVIKLKELVKNGDLGDILSIVVKRVGLFPPQVKDVNVITDLAVHDLDIVTSITGKDPVSVLATGGGSLTKGRDDHAEIFLDYGKFGCFLQVNWVTPIKIRTLSVTGTKGYAELNYVTQKLSLYKSNYKRKQPKGFKEFVVKFGEPEKVDLYIKKAEPLKLELADFVHAVRQNVSPTVTGEEGAKAVALSQLVKESIKTNQNIAMPKISGKVKRILVTGAGGSAAHNFIESLRISKENFYIIGADAKKFHLEMSDCNEYVIIPLVSDKDYLVKLNQLIVEKEIDFVHPQPDPEVLFLSRNREKVKAPLLLPSKETIEVCQEKMQLMKLLSSCGVAVPESYMVNSQKDLKKYLNKILRKNEKAWLRSTTGAGSKASLPVKYFEHARSWINYWEKMKGTGYGKFMISEFLPGKEFAFQSIWKEGKLITSQARERIEYIFGNLTPSGQTSSPSVAKTVHRADVNKIATAAITCVDPKATGVFCVDLKENKNGTPCVTEINAGRFFTTSNFFAHAGSNMPYYYIKMAFGEKLHKLRKYNAIKADLYWVRMMDMGYKLVKDGHWNSVKI